MTSMAVAFDILATDHASKAFEAVGTAAERTGQQVTKTSTVGSKIGSAFGTGLGWAAVGIAGIGIAAIKTGLQTAAANQQAQISFTSLLGSSQKAGDFLKELTSFAAATPFDLPGVELAAKQLLGVGVAAKDVKPFLTAFGDTAGALGLQTDQFNSVLTQTTQAIANGKFQIGDLSALASNGIPVYKLLGEAFHKTSAQISEMATAGQLTSDKVLPALKSQMEKDYGGAMSKQATTLTGQLSTLSDTIDQGLAQVLQPLVPLIGAVLPRATELLAASLTALSVGFAAVGPIAGAAADIFTKVGGAIPTPVFKTLEVAVGAVAGAFAIQTAATVAYNAVTGAAAAVTGLFAVAENAETGSVERGTVAQFAHNLAVGAGTVAKVAAAISTGVVTAATGAWTAAQTALNVVLSANPIGLVVVAVGALAAGLIYAYKHSEAFRDVVNSAFKAVGDFVLGTVSGMIGALERVFDTLGKLPGPFGAPFRAAVGAAKGAQDAVEMLRSKIDNLPTHHVIDFDVVVHGYAAVDAIRDTRVNVGGARAGGGPVTRGVPYLVGELEPEIFVPQVSGTILNGAQLQALRGGHQGPDMSEVVDRLGEVVDAQQANTAAIQRLEAQTARQNDRYLILSRTGAIR